MGSGESPEPLWIRHCVTTSPYDTHTHTHTHTRARTHAPNIPEDSASDCLFSGVGVFCGFLGTGGGCLTPLSSLSEVIDYKNPS